MVNFNTVFYDESTNPVEQRICSTPIDDSDHKTIKTRVTTVRNEYKMWIFSVDKTFVCRLSQLRGYIVTIAASQRRHNVRARGHLEFLLYIL
jgi:hypothetical protein